MLFPRLDRLSIRHLITLTAMAIFCVSSTFASERSQGRLQFIAGTKQLNQQDWTPLDKQSEIGLEFDYRKETWPLWLTLAALRSEDSVTLQDQPTVGQHVKQDSRILEIHSGVKKDFQLSQNIRLSLSAGPAWVEAELDRLRSPFDRDKDSGAGVWGTADVLVFVRGVGLGFSYRVSHASVMLHDQKRDAGGRHLVFSAGLAW